VTSSDEFFNSFLQFILIDFSTHTGQFAFTYNRGNGGECKNPVSKLKSCTEDTRMLLNFQACPDVDGSESTGEIERQKFNQ
jgi:hypothetical protein